MSVRMYAINDITQSNIMPKGWGDIVDLFEGMTDSDEYTYTMRLNVPEEKRDQIKENLIKMQSDGEDTQPLINFLDQFNWDVSFLVDCW